MPNSKHRRKPGEKAIAHPGRGKPGRPLSFDFAWPEEAPAQRLDDVTDLPLFDWAETEEPKPDPSMRKAGG